MRYANTPHAHAKIKCRFAKLQSGECKRSFFSAVASVKILLLSSSLFVLGSAQFLKLNRTFPSAEFPRRKPLIKITAVRLFLPFGTNLFKLFEFGILLFLSAAKQSELFCVFAFDVGGNTIKLTELIAQKAETFLAYLFEGIGIPFLNRFADGA